MAVPVRKDLLVSTKDLFERIKNYINNRLDYEKRSLILIDKALPKLDTLLSNYNLRFNKTSSILNISLISMIKSYKDIFLRRVDHLKINNLIRNFDKSKDMYLNTSHRLLKSTSNIIDSKINSLQLQSGMLDVLSYNSVLKRGFAVIKDNNDNITRWFDWSGNGKYLIPSANLSGSITYDSSNNSVIFFNSFFCDISIFNDFSVI